MANYTVPLLYAPVFANTLKSAGILWAVARRFQVYEVEMGQAGGLASTDCQDQWDLSRFGSTAAGVGTIVASDLLDPADAVSATLFANNLSTELTYTTAGNGLNLKSWSINQRGFNRWRALDDGDNIVVPSTTGFGIGVRTSSITSGFANSAVGGISFIER